MLEDLARALRRDIPPSDRDTKPRLRLAKRPPRGFKPQPSVARFRCKPFREIERNATQRAPELRRELPIPPRNRFNERPSRRNDLYRMFNNVLVEVSVHALPPRSFRDTAPP